MFEYVEWFYYPKPKHTNDVMLSSVDFEISPQKPKKAGVEEIRGGLEVESPACCQGSMIMQLNKIHSVKSISRAAAELGETVERIFNLPIDMKPKDGVIWVYGPWDDRITALSPLGIGNLQELSEKNRGPSR